MKHQWNVTMCCMGIVALSAVGCATTAPDAEIAVSQAALSNAAAAGGPEFAPVEMAAARDKLNRANQAKDKQDNDVARQLATEAEVDAKLAQSKANAAKTQKSVAAAQESNQVLREELSRQNSSGQ